MNIEIDTKCCRTCLEATTENFLFDKPDLLKKLEFVTSLRINEDDGLPIYFCNPCKKKLEISYEFRLQSIRAVKYLKNHISQIQNQFKSIVKSSSDVKIEKQNINYHVAETQHNEVDERKVVEELQELNEEEELQELNEEEELQELNEEDPLHSKAKPKLKNKKKSKKCTAVILKKVEIISPKNISKVNKNLKEIKKINNEDEFNENNGIEYSKCDVCHKMFRKGNLKRHKETHTGDRKFTCDLCNKSFTQKSSLQRHHLTHTGEKPYECEVCRKRFSQSNILKFHMTLHGTKTYNCSICPYRFIKPENLANHMRERHSSGNSDEVVLFVCQFCNKGFRSKYSLKVHKEKLHKDDIVFDMDWSDINDEESGDSE